MASGLASGIRMNDTLSDIGVIRHRPGMYIGDVRDGSGLVHMVWELVANALDEHVAGACTKISITINEDCSGTVQDDGRGIPTHAAAEDALDRAPGGKPCVS